MQENIIRTPAISSLTPVSLCTFPDLTKLLHPAMDAKAVSQGVYDAIEARTPSRILDAICQIPIFSLFMKELPVPYGTNVYDHTFAVLTNWFDQISRLDFPSELIKVGTMAISLHDAAKSAGKLIGSMKGQHHDTIDVISRYRTFWPLESREFSIMLQLIGIDPLGAFAITSQPADIIVAGQTPRSSFAKGALRLRDMNEAFRELLTNMLVEGLEQERNEPSEAIRKAALICANTIRECATKCNLNLRDFQLLLMTYYQADTQAYTTEAKLPQGGRHPPVFDALYDWDPAIPLCARLPLTDGRSLFVWDPQNSRYRFSPGLEPAFVYLERLLDEQD